MATTKQPSVAVVALMLALVVALAPGGARAAACDAAQLAVCVPAITTGAKPVPQCCTNLKEQRPCFCQYAKDPKYGRYIKSPNATKTLQSCGVPVPKC
ncbi:unnamed protein product [Alopecurus aequalis]